MGVQIHPLPQHCDKVCPSIMWSSMCNLTTDRCSYISQHSFLLLLLLFLQEVMVGAEIDFKAIGAMGFITCRDGYRLATPGWINLSDQSKVRQSRMRSVDLLQALLCHLHSEGTWQTDRQTDRQMTCCSTTRVTTRNVTLNATTCASSCCHKHFTIESKEVRT